MMYIITAYSDIVSIYSDFLSDVEALCYNVAVSETKTTEDFDSKFVESSVCREIVTLDSKYSIPVRMYKHPITAIQKYRITMCKANIYPSLLMLKVTDVTKDKIALSQARCEYYAHCSKQQAPICLRGLSIGCIVTYLSGGAFKDAEARCDTGSCTIKLSVNYENLLEIPPDERNLKDIDSITALTCGESIIFRKNVWLGGMKKAAVMAFDEKKRHEFLGLFDVRYSKILEKYKLDDDDLKDGSVIDQRAAITAGQETAKCPKCGGYVDTVTSVCSRCKLMLDV